MSSMMMLENMQRT